MSGSTNLFEAGTGLRGLSAQEAKRINDSITFVRQTSATKYSYDLSTLKFVAVNGMAQPGLCVNWTRIDARTFLKPQLLSLMPESLMTGKTVLFNVSTPDSGGTLWPPILFHECGHALFDGSGSPNEPAAWRVELEVSLAWVGQNTTEKAAFKTFVQTRKALKMYTSFPSTAATSANEALGLLQA